MNHRLGVVGVLMLGWSGCVVISDPQFGDNDGANDTHTLAVTVEDTSPPVITVPELAADCLWPPNHQMLLSNSARMFWRKPATRARARQR